MVGGGGGWEYTMYNTVGEKRQDKRRRSKTYKERNNEVWGKENKKEERRKNFRKKRREKDKIIFESFRKKGQSGERVK